MLVLSHEVCRTWKRSQAIGHMRVAQWAEYSAYAHSEVKVR